jgi:hypothetical protein
MRREFCVAVALAGLALCPDRAKADDAAAIMEWNQIAVGATVTAGQGPIPQIRTMTIVQVAVHDAVSATTCRYRTYLSIPCRGYGSPDGAAIGAAHRALVRLFSTQSALLATLDAARTASLAAHGLSETDPAVVFGETVAEEIVAARLNDGAAQAQFPYTAPGAGEPGVWVAVGAAAPATPGWKDVTPWVLQDLSRFAPDGPPSLHTRRWARDYNEVKEIGSLTSASRSEEQTKIAHFWLASPTAIWNPVARQMIEAHGLDSSAAARAFALFYLAPADASIVCWDAKYTFNFWRPITAIRNGDTDGNVRTEGDSAWTPLLTTPQHPEYLSGHSTNSAAMAAVLAFLFGDKPGVPIVATSSTAPAGFTREWERFSDGVDEVIEARIYGGIHYRTSDEDGAAAGRKVARSVVLHSLRPRHPFKH